MKPLFSMFAYGTYKETSDLRFPFLTTSLLRHWRRATAIGAVVHEPALVFTLPHHCVVDELIALGSSCRQATPLLCAPRQSDAGDECDVVV